MENTKEFIIEQKAIVWYRTTVEAETKEQALQIAQNDNNGYLDWWQNTEGVLFCDAYWIMDTETNESELIENE